MKENLLPMAESLYAAHKSNSQNKFAAIDYILIAEELQSAKRTDEAVTVLKEAIADMPENAAFNKQLAMVYVDSNDLVSAAKSYKGYLEKSEKPSYNDYIQQSVFSFYAGVQSKGNGESNYMTYFDESKEYASKASEILPDNYKPSKIRGDIAKQLASKDNVGSAAVSMYTQAVELLEASSDPSKYASDAKDMYNYLGNYYLDQKNTAKAKEYFNKYLKYDPNNSDYRKFVDNLK
jgi:tetratricopeptide (TPR) repeat protein